MLDFKKYYRDPGFPGSLGGIDSFYRGLKEKFPLVEREDVARFLLTEDSYTMHKMYRKPKKYRRIYAKGINYQLQIDLCDLTKYADDNDGYKFILTCIDVFSKKAHAFPLKNKAAVSICDAMRDMLTNNPPQKIEFDQGTEFYNHRFLAILKRLKIQHFSVYSSTKGACVERFNRTLKTRMSAYFTARKTKRYIDILDDLIKSYNGTLHSSIGLAPDAVNSSNEARVRQKLYPTLKPSKPAIFKKGDSVRLNRLKSVFEKDIRLVGLGKSCL